MKYKLKEKVPVEIDDKMYQSYSRIWVGGILVNKRFQDYKNLTQDLDKLGYDTSEYHRQIEVINRGLVGKL